jgi:hypothetical protein
LTSQTTLCSAAQNLELFSRNVCLVFHQTRYAVSIYD